MKRLPICLAILGAFSSMWIGSVLSNDQMSASTAEPSVIPRFEQAGIPTDKFEIKFANLHLSYKMAVFESDKDVCENAFLFVFIPTRPTSFDIRQAIRTSWVGDRPSGVVVKFVIGLTEDFFIFDAILKEQKVFGDLILYDIEDTYENLFLKVHAAFNWQQAYCGKVEYVLKTDDDTIVDLHRLLYWIEHDIAYLKQNQPAIICGGIWKGAIPHRSKEHKWYVSWEAFPEERFPNYANGPTYLLSSEAVFAILSNTQIVDAFSLEDVLFTGVISAKAGVHREEIWKYFRFTDKIQTPEKCSESDRVPLLTAIYGHWSVEEYALKYNALKTAKCNE